MEFRFDIRPLFNQPIIRVTNHMLPQNFRGDRRMAANTAQQISEIIDVIGEHSAKAQGLNKAVTTANKLRQSEQKIYLLADVDDGKRGSVIGMLKVGEKTLYVFDENGDTKKVDAPCILDFYIHESRQRAGLGKDLFTTMLKDENWQPQKLAIDRPSDKLLGFLRKHYNLDKTIPQMNNFVIYAGFFDGPNGTTSDDDFHQVHMTTSPNTALFGPYRASDDNTSDERTRKVRVEQQASYYSPIIHNTPIGRYAAARPLGSMGEQNASYSQRRQVVEKRSGLQAVNERMENIPKYVMPSSTTEIRRAGLDSKRTYMYGAPSQIANRVIENQTRLIAHNQLSNDNANAAANLNPSEPIQSHQIINGPIRQRTGESNSNTNDDQQSVTEEVESVRIEFENLNTEPEPEPEPEIEPEPENEHIDMPDCSNALFSTIPATPKLSNMDEQNIHNRFQQRHHNKQHTGMKNISTGVGAAVTPTNKMEFYQENPEDFGIVKINQPACQSTYSQSDNVSVVSVGSGDGYTRQGHYDLKFHHNTLW